MFGTVVNFLAILLGSALGILFRKRISPNMGQGLFRAMGLAVMYVGIAGVLKTEDSIVLIISIALGTLLGEHLNIEGGLERLSEGVETFMSRFTTGRVKEGFLTATLLFCVGSMAIIGPLESTLTGNHATLYAKSILDGITSIIFASTLGIGVMLSSVSVLLYQGLISVFAGLIKPFMTAPLIASISSVGSLLILGLGINMVFDAKLKVSNMLPSILVPVGYFLLVALTGWSL